jgi:hypothetical protein
MLLVSKKINILLNEKFTIFASSSRLYCRLLHNGFYLFGLATEAACSLTGLFLLHQSEIILEHIFPSDLSFSLMTEMSKL